MQPLQAPPVEKKVLKVNLRGREHGYYSNLMSQVDVKAEGKVGGKEAVTFFKSSGLSVDKLKEIWVIAS